MIYIRDDINTCANDSEPEFNWCDDIIKLFDRIEFDRRPVGIVVNKKSFVELKKNYFEQRETIIDKLKYYSQYWGDMILCVKKYQRGNKVFYGLDEMGAYLT